MKLSLDKVKALCYQQNTSVGSMLREAGVSRNAFYTLARSKSVVPQSLIRIAADLGVPVHAPFAGTVRELDDQGTVIERAL